MGRLQQGITDVFFSGLSLILSLSIFLFILPQTTTPENIGFIRYIYSYSNLIIIFVHFGTPYVILKYYHSFKPKERNIYNFFILLVSLVGFLLLGGITAVSHYLFDFNIFKVYKTINTASYIILFTFASSLVVSINNFFIYKSKPQFSTPLATLISRLGLFICCIFLGWNIININSVATGIVISQFCTLFYFIYLVYRTTDFKISLSFKFKEQVSSFKETIKYLSFTFISSLGGKVTAYIDEIMVASILGFSFSGAYGIGLLLASIINIPYTSIAKLLNPKINFLLKHKEHNKLESIYKQSSYIGFLISTTLYTSLYLGAQFLFSIIPNGHFYSSSINILGILGFAHIINMTFGLNSDIISFSTYYRFHLYSILILGILTIILNYLFIGYWGMSGAAMSTVLATLIFNLFKFLVIKSKFNIIPFSIHTFYQLVSFAISFYISSLIKTDNIWLMTFMKLISFFLIYGLSMYLFGLHKIIKLKPTE